jgi:ATP-dependent DNA ligase
MRYYVFDPITYREKSLLNVPLQTRRELLVEALADTISFVDLVRLSQTVDAKPEELISAAAEMRLGGISAKRKDSLYESDSRLIIANASFQSPLRRHVSPWLRLAAVQCRVTSLCITTF